MRTHLPQIAVVMFVLTIAGSACAAPRTTAVTVLPDRYVSEGRTFHDLDALEAYVRAQRPALLEVGVCGAPATRPWKATVYRFRDLPLALRAFEADERECRAPALVPVAARGRAALDVRDERAVERYWRELMP